MLMYLSLSVCICVSLCVCVSSFFLAVERVCERGRSGVNGDFYVGGKCAVIKQMTTKILCFYVRVLRVTYIG